MDNIKKSLKFITSFFNFEEFYTTLYNTNLSDIYEDDIHDTITESFLDFSPLYDNIKENTLNLFLSKKEYLSFIMNNSDNKNRISEGICLWNLITEKNGHKLPYCEIGEDTEIDLTKGVIYLSLIYDTSYSNEGGSHAGGYEFYFTIDLINKVFNGLEIINHN